MTKTVYRIIKLFCFSSILQLLVVLPSFAAIEVYNFNDPQLADRFKKLTYELRCPKCQNQNLADSNATLSVDLKDIIYEKLKAGESDDQIIGFMKQRYGEFILFKPEMSKSNSLLWFGPIVFLLAFLFLFFRWYRNNRDLSDE